jgi:hypothetical protein
VTAALTERNSTPRLLAIAAPARTLDPVNVFFDWLARQSASDEPPV